MRHLEDFYVKNTMGDSKIYYRLKPIIFPENEFTYLGTEILTKEGEGNIENHELTYRDILQMYEDGFYTIEREEFERVQAMVSEETEKEHILED
ncbi:hypothetical protein OKW21_002911 [Catalinimonas alkaloidigena]|uniref:hypothetical protein n=1 Tax=Catalinimonas alkaloidigena TaxID=1075417 RepID=UPI0024064FDF|nr:hypothetical protein [Catalinimonas alkaloidigena]MDF9797648.1 hypothetical protein [Catalinimonas alkaloidigena]